MANISTKIIVFSDDKNLNSYDSICNDTKFSIVGRTNEFNRLKAFIVMNKNSTIIIDESVCKDDYETVFEYLDKYSCICIFNATKYIPSTIIGKYNCLNVVYRTQYKTIDMFMAAIVNKINVAHAKIEQSSASENRNVNNHTILKENRLDNIDEKKKVTFSSNIMFSTDVVGNFLSPNKFELMEKYHLKRFDYIVAIGASTGGPDTIFQVIKELPEDFKYPIVIVQHMPENFTKMYAQRMNKECKIKVVEGFDGDPLLGGCAYIAPGGKQMVVQRMGGNYNIKILPFDNNYVNNPAVDVTFDSVANTFGPKVVGVILTGMGKDGSKGLLNIRNRGGYTVGQDEKTCIVYGMPQVAFDIGAVSKQLPIERIGEDILNFLK